MEAEEDERLRLVAGRGKSDMFRVAAASTVTVNMSGASSTSRLALLTSALFVLLPQSRGGVGGGGAVQRMQACPERLLGEERVECVSSNLVCHSMTDGCPRLMRE